MTNIGDELAKRIGKIGLAVVDSKQRACLAGAMVIERYAKEDEEIPVETGFLSETTYARNADDKESAEVVSEASYAWYVHMGTENQAAQPYFTNTIVHREDEIVDAIKNQLQNDIKKNLKF